MAVAVTTNSLDIDTYPDATGWFVDDNRILHILKKNSGNIGVYPDGEWLRAWEVEPVTRPDGPFAT